MQIEKVSTISNTLQIDGLTENDLNILGHWYAYYTFKRKKGIQSKWGYTLGDNIINRKTMQKGKKLFANILSKLEKFDSPLIVESLNEQNNVRLKCKNINGDNIIIEFEHGDLIDHSTKISIIDEKTVKRVAISLTKGAIFEKLNYLDYGTEEINKYYETIYQSAYNIDQKNL